MKAGVDLASIDGLQQVRALGTTGSPLSEDVQRWGIAQFEAMGTSELYSAVEALPEVLDSLVVDLEYLGQPLDKVVNLDAMANPLSLKWYTTLATTRLHHGTQQPSGD